MSIAISDHLARPYRFYLLIWCLNTDILINSNQFIKTKPSLETRDFLSFQVLKSFIFRMKLDTVTTQDNDPTCVTYIINGEDDTLGNSLRLIIASYKEVELCQYTRPHPTEDCIHLRIQTYGKTPGIPEQIKISIYKLKSDSNSYFSVGNVEERFKRFDLFDGEGRRKVCESRTGFCCEKLK